MKPRALDTLAWSVAIACTLAAVVASTAPIGYIVTLTLAAAWCRRLDREDEAFQVFDADVNRYPTHGSVSR